MTEIINFGGAVSTEAGQYVPLDTDAAISGNDTLLSITVALVDFAGTSINDFLEVKHVGGITLESGSDRTQILYNGQLIGHIGSDGAGGELSLHFDGYGPAVTNESVTAALRAIAYTNTSSTNPSAEERTVRISLEYGDSNPPLVTAVDKNVLVRPDNAIVLTSDSTNVTGTEVADVFVLSSSTTLQSVSLNGGSGTDAVHIVGGGSLDLSGFSKFWGVEALRGSAEGDTFNIQSRHLLAISEIDGGLQDGTDGSANILNLSGSYFDFRNKTLSNIHMIELTGGTSPVFVFDSGNIGSLFVPNGQELRCVIDLGTSAANSIFRLSGIAPLSQEQRTALEAAGFANIYDSGNTPTTGGPATTELNGDTVGVAPGATVLLDLNGNSTVTSAEAIRKVLLRIPDSVAGDLLGLRTGDGIILGPDGLQEGGAIQIGIAQGILTSANPNHLEITFLSGGSASAAEALVKAMTYTRPAEDTFEPRPIQVILTDDLDRLSMSTITIVDGVPRDVRMGAGVTEITVDEGPEFEITLSATDDDTPAADLTYRFETFGDVGGKFIIDNATKQLKLAPGQSLNFEDQVGGQGGYNVYVKAYDGTTYSAVQELTIKAADVNEAPIFVTFGPPQRTIRKGTTGPDVGVVHAFWEDPDMVGDFRHNKFAFLVGSDLLTRNGGFSIDEETGQITTNNEIFDEEAGIKQLVVVAVDENDESLRAQATHNVEIIPTDAPPIVQFASGSVTVTQAEGTGTGTTAYTFTVIRDIDVGRSEVKWTLRGDTAEPDDFSGSLSGTVVFENNQFQRTITILVNKDDQNEEDKTFTVSLFELDDGTSNAIVGNTDHTATGAITNDDTVAPVNGPPSAPVLSGATAREYDAAGTPVGTLSATDPDGDALSYELLDTAGGRFMLEGNRILVADGFRLDFEQQAAHTIKVRVKDATHTVDKDLVIAVLDVGPESTAGSAANDVFWGGAGNDMLAGNLGDDRLLGQGGADTLKGEAGHDVLGGGAGRDKLTGGKSSASRDAFLFDARLTTAKGAPSKSLANQHKDQILDFGPKFDSLWFDDAAFTNKTIAKSLKGKAASLDKPVKLKASFFKKGAKATDKDDFFVYNAKTRKLYFDVDGSGSKAMVEIASLKLQKGEGSTLSASDFFFVRRGNTAPGREPSREKPERHARPGFPSIATPAPVKKRASCSWLRRPLLGVEQAAVHQSLGDLDRVQGRALAQVVGHAPEGEAVLDRDVLADAGDVGGILAGRFVGRDVAARLVLIDHHDARSRAQDVARLLGAERLFELHVHGLRMADEDRHAHASGGELDLGIQDLLGLRHHLPLFLREPVLHEHVDLGDQVEGDALGKLLLLHVLERVERLGLAVELVHAFLAGAGDGLVGRHDDALDGGAVMERLEGDHELRRGAVRVGDDALLHPADGVGVHLRDHERHVRVVAPGGGVVDHHRSLRGDLRRPFLRDLAAGRHEAQVDVGKVVGVEGLGLQRLVAEGNLRALAAAGGQCHHLVGRKGPLCEDVEHLAAHIACRADHGDLVTHWTSPVWLSPEMQTLFGCRLSPRRERGPGTTRLLGRFHGRRDGFRFARRAEQRHCHRPSESPVCGPGFSATHQEPAFVKRSLDHRAFPSPGSRRPRARSDRPPSSAAGPRGAHRRPVHPYWRCRW